MTTDTTLNVNDQAPDFALPNASGEDIKLSNFRGRWVVLYFYPKDATPGCTIEAIDFSINRKKFMAKNAVVLGISKDSCHSHQKFIEKENISILLLSDESTEIHKTYGVWKPKKLMGHEFLGTIRTTFLINPEGKIQYIWNNVSAKGHAYAVLEKLTELSA